MKTTLDGSELNVIPDVDAALLVKVLLPPLGFLVIGVLAKFLGRRDGDDSPHRNRNDCAVGTTVLLMTLAKVVADIQIAASQSVTASQSVKYPPTVDLLLWLIAILLAAFAFVNFDRYVSWEVGPDNKWRKRLFYGVILPDVAGVIIFVSYQIYLVTGGG